MEIERPKRHKKPYLCKNCNIMHTTPTKCPLVSKKISREQKIRMADPKARENLRNQRLGKKLSEQTKYKKSIAMLALGDKNPAKRPEVREILSNQKIGHEMHPNTIKALHQPKTQSHKDHISESKIGTESHRKGLSLIAEYGPIKGEEIRKKILIAQPWRKVGNKPSDIEIKINNQINEMGFEYEREVTDEGHPDFYLPKFNLLIFADGCFTHNCPKCRLVPNIDKPIFNRKRAQTKVDEKYNLYWKEKGYKILRLWEHDILKKDFHIAPYLEEIK